MTRQKGWQGRLAAFLASVARTPFSPGTHDCALFAAGAVEALTGVDLAADWRGRYHTLRGGVRVLRRAGYADHIALARSHFPATTTPRPGDLAVVSTPDGPALGVVQGLMIYAPAAIGWALVPLDAATEFFEV